MSPSNGWRPRHAQRKSGESLSRALIRTTGTSDVMRIEDRTHPDVTRTSSKDQIGVRCRDEDENSAGHPSSAESDSRSRITTKREPRESVMSNRAPLNSTFREGYPGKRRHNVENNTLNWVSISLAGALDMTRCDFSVRSARDEMRPHHWKQ